MNPSVDQVIAHYERHARNWDADRQQTRFSEQKWFDRFAALLPSGASILDLGCGSGAPIAKYLIDRSFNATGIDGSETMISLCRGRFPGHQWEVADMRTLSLGKVFQGIVVWDSLFHLSRDDQRRMFPVFKEHAAPRAALLFTSGPCDGEVIGSYRGYPLYHASLSAEEYRSLLSANGFAVRAHVAEDPDCGQHTVWLAQSK